MLRHGPTGVQVNGEVEQGHYSREQFARLKDDLLKQLWNELEGRAATHLRVPRQ